MFQQTSSVQLPFLCCNCTKTLWLELGNDQYFGRKYLLFVSTKTILLANQQSKTPKKKQSSSRLRIRNQQMCDIFDCNG